MMGARVLDRSPNLALRLAVLWDNPCQVQLELTWQKQPTSCPFADRSYIRFDFAVLLLRCMTGILGTSDVVLGRSEYKATVSLWAIVNRV